MSAIQKLRTLDCFRVRCRGVPDGLFSLHLSDGVSAIIGNGRAIVPPLP